MQVQLEHGMVFHNPNHQLPMLRLWAAEHFKGFFAFKVVLKIVPGFGGD